MIVDLIIPAFNEEKSIGKVLSDLPSDVLRFMIVVDNNSSDLTGEIASQNGALVLRESIQGYGASCLKGMDFISKQDILPDVVVFLDGDYSDHPDQLPLLLDPIRNNEADFVLGSRSLGAREKLSMMPQQIFGNWLATKLLKVIYGYSFTDLGPFRAIKYDKLVGLRMEDLNYGWTVEMQIKAAKQKLRCIEVPVKYRVRIGESKVSGTVKGTVMAGYKIISTLLKYA